LFFCHLFDLISALLQLTKSIINSFVNNNNTGVHFKWEACSVSIHSSIMLILQI